MYAIRRWWTRYGLRIGLVFLVLGTAWTVRQTQGSIVFEFYQLLSFPFQGKDSQQQLLQNAQAQELQQRLTELENQNEQLKALLGYQSNNSNPGVAAPVIGRSADHWWQQIILGRGAQAGIRLGSVVSGTGGIVGRVVEVTGNTSRVLLISDPSSQVGVTVSRSRAMGYLRGQAENRAVMEFFDKVPDVRPGDTITTSSFSQLFPPGLPVGRVESVNMSKSPAPEAVIQLSAPISALEWVTVSPNSKPAASEVLPIPQSSPIPGAADSPDSSAPLPTP